MRSKRTKGRVTKKGSKVPRTKGVRYRATRRVIQAIDALAPTYASKGKTLLVATELLARMRKPIEVSDRLTEGDPVGVTYKISVRTADLIGALASQYGTRGNVLAACAQVLTDPNVRVTTAH